MFLSDAMVILGMRWAVFQQFQTSVFWTFLEELNNTLFQLESAWSVEVAIFRASYLELKCRDCRQRSRLLRSGAPQFAPEPRLQPAARHWNFKCRLWRRCVCRFGNTISDDNIGARWHLLIWLFASWFSDNLAGSIYLYYVANTCVIECYNDDTLEIACQVVCFFMGPGRVVIMSYMLYQAGY